MNIEQYTTMSTTYFNWPISLSCCCFSTSSSLAGGWFNLLTIYAQRGR